VTKAEKEESGIDHVIRPFRTPRITPLHDFQPAPSVNADFLKRQDQTCTLIQPKGDTFRCIENSPVVQIKHPDRNAFSRVVSRFVR
jgi:hypothetical protein